MNQKRDEDVFRQILEKTGGQIADKAQMIMLEDPNLKKLEEPLKFISKNWRDLTPALMSLSCEAVNGNSEESYEPALALSLMNLSFTVWDEVIDHAKSKSFKPTLYARFGQDTAIIIGGVACAKAFCILNEMSMKDEKRKRISRIVWKLWSKMASVEITTLREREQGTFSSSKKFWKIKSEAVDLGACFKIGAIIGNGSNEEIKHLERYGRCLSIILALQRDFQVSVNLTVELAEKIKNNRLPYSLLWAIEQSKQLKIDLEKLRQESLIDNRSLAQFIEAFLGTGIRNHLAEKINKYKKMAESDLSYLANTDAMQSLKRLLTLNQFLFLRNQGE